MIFKKIENKEEIKENLFISDAEKEFIEKHDEIYFKNGINITDEKHKKQIWIFAFIPISNNILRNHIEIEWRAKNGIPILCSYTSGR